MTIAATDTTRRHKLSFTSGGTDCAAWHYPGTNGACVVMAGGLAVTKEPATDRFAARFHDAGFSVLAFDFRRIGESGGEPRQVVRIGDQEADYRAAIGLARTLPEVDPSRVAIWGFSLSGGHVFAVASQLAGLGAAIAVSPLADGLASAPNALRHVTPMAMVRLNLRALLDVIGGLFGQDPLLVPLAAGRGEVAALTTPDSRNGRRALNPDDRYPEWQQAVAARSALVLAFYRPGRHATRIPCPLLLLAPDADGVAPQGAAIKAVQRAPRGEIASIPGGHYAPLLDAHEQAVEVQLSFLGRHLLR